MKHARLSFTVRGDEVEILGRGPTFEKRIVATRAEASGFARQMLAALAPAVDLDPREVLRLARSH
jgi:hypothetical protein